MNPIKSIVGIGYGIWILRPYATRYYQPGRASRMRLTRALENAGIRVRVFADGWQAVPRPSAPTGAEA